METITFTLRTTDISIDNIFANYYGQTVATSTGQISNSRQTITWYNVNMKNMLGDMYDRYNKFCIGLVSVGVSSTNVTATTINDDRTWNINMSGLPFSSPSSNGSNNSVSLGLLRLGVTSNTSSVINFSAISYNSFFKTSDNLNITISLNSILTNAPILPDVVGKVIGQTTFIFQIYGVENYKTIDDNNNITLKNRLEVGKLNFK